MLFLWTCTKNIKFDNVQNTSLTPDEELKILIHGTALSTVVYRSYTF